MSNGMKCSKCGAIIEAGDMFCGECGAKAEAAPPPQPRPAPTALAKCPTCGAMVQPGWQFCDKCGGAMSGRSATPPPQPPPAAPPQYQQPPPPAAAPPGYGQYAQPAQAPPPTHNTSGMGSAYPTPPEVNGISCAGAVPLGLFAFMNGMTGLGVLGLFSFVPLIGLIYFLIIMITGKAQAWRSKRFNDIYQFQATMRAWHGWGVFFIVLNILGAIAYLILVFWLSFSAETAGSTTPSDDYLFFDW